MTRASTAASHRPPGRRLAAKGKPASRQRRPMTIRPLPRPDSKGPATCATRAAAAKAALAATVDASSGTPKSKSKSTSEQTTSGGRDDEAADLTDGDRGVLSSRLRR